MSGQVRLDAQRTHLYVMRLCRMLHTQSPAPQKPYCGLIHLGNTISRYRHDISLVRVTFDDGAPQLSPGILKQGGKGGLGSVKATRACMFFSSLGELRGFTSNGCDLRHMCVGEHVFPTSLSSTVFFFLLLSSSPSSLSYLLIFSPYHLLTFTTQYRFISRPSKVHVIESLIHIRIHNIFIDSGTPHLFLNITVPTGYLSTD
jgi:hypothetical protein